MAFLTKKEKFEKANRKRFRILKPWIYRPFFMKLKKLIEISAL